MKCFNTSVNIKKNYIVIRYSGALFTARYYSLSPFLEIFFSSLVHQLALQLISRPNGVLLVSKKSLSPRSPWIRPRCLPSFIQKTTTRKWMLQILRSFLFSLFLSLFLFSSFSRRKGRNAHRRIFVWDFFAREGEEKNFLLMEELTVHISSLIWSWEHS